MTEEINTRLTSRVEMYVLDPSDLLPMVQHFIVPSGLQKQPQIPTGKTSSCSGWMKARMAAGENRRPRGIEQLVREMEVLVYSKSSLLLCPCLEDVAKAH
ncbi:hypothetical protein MLD38_033888 [Melastoma candidum]|uniref:Uncharacterized protein n=1 Tax=Melastoma candidum TaxID=119954 RepID=A0ACB9MAA3_9MYRT|nr:hypothetical protein MLD38_033888 [Melastoma candidum]